MNELTKLIQDEVLLCILFVEDIVLVDKIKIDMELPMSYSSTDTSFSHNNWLEGEVMGSRPIRCIC